MKKLLLFALIFSTTYTYGQTIRGKVTDAMGLMPLQGVQISVQSTGVTYNDYTQADGKFKITGIAAGRYIIKCTKEKYRDYIIEEILALSGKEIFLDIQMQRIASPLQTIEVSAAPVNKGNLNTQTIRVEQTLRLASVNDDVARAATFFAGVMAVNDGCNHISINGHSPNNVGWYINDLQVENPNHLANGGTVSDRPASAGGGVSMLSSNVLSHTNFYNGIFDIQLSNSLGGAFSNYFRAGNNEKYEYTLQAGLIGTDAAIEGPLGKNSGASFLVNYRYSFTGLLALMGISFGGEVTRYQDLSFSVNIPVRQNNTFTIFGLTGANSNTFHAPDDTSEWTSQKYLTNKSFAAQSLFSGASWLHTFSNNSLVKASVGINITSNERKSAPSSTMLHLPELYNRSHDDRYIPYHIFYSSTFMTKHSVRLGINGRTGNIKQQQHSYDNGINIYVDDYNREYTIQQHYPYVDYKYRMNTHVTIELGVQSKIINDIKAFNLNYVGKFIYAVNPRHQVQYAVNSTSEMVGQFMAKTVVSTEIKFQPMLNKAVNHSLMYVYTGKKASVWRAELFYQQLYDIAVAATKQNSYSSLNDWEITNNTKLAANGTGLNYGTNLQYQKPITDHVYYVIGGSIFDTKYKGSDNIERHTRFDNNFSVTAAGGYEWKNKNGNKIFGINLRALYGGGMRYTPINEDASASAGETVVYDIAAFELRHKDYFRTDFRFTYRVNRAHHNFLFALDVQNITGNINTDYIYYDIYSKKIAIKNQLSTIPILSLKYSF